MIPGLPLLFLHTASDQKLDGGKVWERDYGTQATTVWYWQSQHLRGVVMRDYLHLLACKYSAETLIDASDIHAFMVLSPNQKFATALHTQWLTRNTWLNINFINFYLGLPHIGLHTSMWRKISEVLMIVCCTNWIVGTKEAKHEAAKFLAERGAPQNVIKTSTN